MLAGFKTIIVNSVTLVVVLLEMVMAEQGLINILPDSVTVWLVVALAVGNILLRFVTKTPVFSGGAGEQ